ncbi:glycosyltransferase [Azonexus sp.]|uniref:glycosyltransferase n=1 Tax=Azonexus sp. TaxID=1872668 RepID=UPI0027B8A6E1|nr:glycosyltransferase [Azonexus sp.]
MKAKAVCFISETGRGDRPLHDPSVRYRAYHPAETLLKSGVCCAVYSAEQFYKKPCFDYDVYVFHRPNTARSMFCEAVTILRRLKRCLIADYDDLIFGDEKLALESSAAKNGSLTPERAIAAFSSNLDGLRCFDRVTTSTVSLADRAREYNPGVEVMVVPNIVPESVLAFQESIGTPFLARDSNMIGYFAGTKSHDHDFPVIEVVLHRVLSENRRLKLLVIGPVKVPPSLASLPNVTVGPVVNYLQLPGLMSKCSTVIAPLENTAFNECKSRVKFLEAALSGCRLITSPIPDMQVIGSNHITLAANLDDWYEALSEPLGRSDQVTLAARNFSFLKDNCTVDGLVTLGELL